MHYERDNLPADVQEIFFSDVFYYAASTVTTRGKRPRYVGCGQTRDLAIGDMRRLAGAKPAGVSPQPGPPPPPNRTTLTEVLRAALAGNLRRLRQAQGMSQYQVARDALGFQVSHAFISRLEACQLANVETQRLEKLAAFFGIAPSVLTSPALP